jgi:hypothetical protein
VQEPESTSPPTALRVEIGACLEQHVQHLAAAHLRDNRRVENGDRIVNLRLHLGMEFQQSAERPSVVFGQRFLEQLRWVVGCHQEGLDVFLELRPGGEAVFARDDPLNVA